MKRKLLTIAALALMTTSMVQAQTTIFGLQSSWKFNDADVALPATWKNANYDVSTWASGNGPLGYGDPVTTAFVSGVDTAYLTKDFTVNLADLTSTMEFGVRRDDGIVVYLNGEEVIRDNMPAGVISHGTFSSTTVDGAAETAINVFTIPKNKFVQGNNRISIELHNRSAGSSDLTIDAYLKTIVPPQPLGSVLIQGSSWSYKDDNQPQAAQWKDSNYNIAAWTTGNGPLGYGDPVTTTINSGLATAYFAKDFTANLADLSANMELGVMRDDGIVVYLNGQEVVRDNMPTGTITHDTFSSTIIDGAAENIYNTFVIPKNKFVQGTNRIAIEVHNRDLTSSDLRMDAYIQNSTVVAPPVSCNTGTHISCFTSIIPTTQTSKLIIPAEHKYQLILKEGDSYTEGGGLVGGQNDFTAYVAKNNSSVDGYLSVNHETNPGGVTMAEVNYNPTTKLWQLSRSRAVSFSGTSLVQTIRNCSGGITPWGTVVTAEESVTSADTNADGYKDYGWLVEINPATAQVMSHNTNGTKDKLWQMGIMNHENVVVNDAGTVAYYGEDGGTNMVYKYVLDTPNDLTSGNLYVLKLTSGLSGGNPVATTGEWIQIPNKTQANQNNTTALAQSLGGTAFNGVEDVEISPLDGKVYFTAKGLNKVYRMTDNGMTLSNVETFVGGASTVYSFNTAQGIKTEAWGDGNDNLTFDELGNLWVLQDGGKNYIWVIGPDHTQANPNVRLFASMPAGSEPTGLTFTPDKKFGFFSIQHPNSTISTDIDATGNTIDYRGKSATVVVALSQFLGNAGSLATSEVIKETEVTVAPNPTSGIVKINSPKALKNLEITAYSIDGKIVFKKKYSGSTSQLELDLTNELNVSRVLVLNIEAEGFQKTAKILKK
ncbi:alkaline phosphatase PhoX [Chryseobacterium sp. Leaf394]|uniref:alkaline phosphatase PhoX n=1 Tax=Chryseobacterium sp. Leaf394 TaxID=1736361 RepID=UPI000A6D53D9|nr:alkaline phosphatase PhoX [Chryseobacterium sp. Leaf394]